MSTAALGPTPTRRRRRELVTDGGWTLALTVFTYFGSRGANDIRGTHRGLDLLGWVLVFAAPILLVAVRRRPREVYAAITVLVAIYLLRDYGGGPIYLALIAAAAVLGWSQPLRSSLVLIVAGAVVVVAAGSTHPDSPHPFTAFLLILTWSLVPVVPWALTALARASITANRQAAAERHRHEVDSERVRIAREVHDVVGHSLAVISMQAGVALHVAESRPQQTRVALEAIARSSHDALTQLRQTVAVLRGDDTADGANPGLGGLAHLVTDFDPNAHRVRLQIDADLDAVPAAVGSVVYRLVQESLTNVARHAGTVPVGVSVGRRDDVVTVDVVNEGSPCRSAAVPGSGLLGMRERCAALGGRFVAGPREPGGWAVHAELPLDVADPA